ncbi:MAG: hypothetical protein UY91_C0003G0022 [Parcubacteria group bacterium GW2011_GWB1_55_9]|nr:MAG: hypothetical protein UY91_C0003G0022 [Parcubacteria group bacterium GW2011_GWB1_55_9]
MKTATYHQIKDVAVRLLNLSTDGVDGDAIQKGTEGYSTDDVNRRLKAFLNNGLSFIMKGPGALIVDRAKPFDEGKYLPIWRGPKDGNGLKGKEEQDARSLALTEFDFAKVLFTACLKDGESVITGEEKLMRHIATKHIRLDAKTFDITWFELPGTVLRNDRGSRYFLFLYRSGDGRWYWSYYWLDNFRVAENPSAVLAS